MNPNASDAWHAVGGLVAVALLATALLVGMKSLTQDRIDAAERRAQLQALAIVLPPSLYDNDPLRDSVRVIAPDWLGTPLTVDVRRARRNGYPTAMVLQAVAPDGYGGPIALLIGVDGGGRLTGVRVTAHQETPGLGDAIETRRGDWITRFAGRFLGDPPEAGWTVRSDGGAFDQFAGATQTPRAVVKAVHRVLEFVRKHGREIEAATTGAQLRFDDAPESPVSHASAPP